MNTRSSHSTCLGLLALGALVLTPACKKEQETTNPDEVETAAEGGDETPEETPEVDALPEQEPDPEEIAALYQRYLQGDYEAVRQEADALREGLTADTQIRARALASSLAALAAAESVPEDGKATSEQAVADGERLDDAEVRQLALIAHATYLVRVHEAAAGQAELESALELGGPYASLNQLMLAEAHLNQAFGVGEEDSQLKHPERLDDAKLAYEAAIDGSTPILAGHAHEGLAAIAKYQRETELICEHAQKAEDVYAAEGATDYIREVPSLLANDARCKDFKKAE
ncbi:hypothetical protein ENSA5_11250 [Enhygromyxa salina]|uniref:Lipoprotein n=1 Tax=Enhygromyxa salina TaxID=215803 RepID=A0A2S9YG47_9BACT|nr:hypothetical protein [Enhygromyxa salina]PRQ04077.1 hypothetical protein ENSA5_11250 [Enhygromyxa salina]